MAQANATIYALVLTQGQYEDRYDTILACYSDKSDADNQIHHMITEIGILRGLIAAESILREVWHKANPQPEYADNSPAYDAYSSACDVEFERINVLLGIDAKCKALRVDSFSADYGHAHVSLKEVQLNPLDSAPYANGGIWKDHVGGTRGRNEAPAEQVQSDNATKPCLHCGVVPGLPHTLGCPDARPLKGI